MKPKIVLFTLASALIFLNAGCVSQPASLPVIISPTNLDPTLTPTLTFQPSETRTETVEASPTYPPTPTPIPNSWLTYTNPALHLKFRYPQNWSPATPTRYSGPDGYFELLLQAYPASEFDSISTLCVLEANEKKPATYGASPYISVWQGWDPQQQIWAGFGCTLAPENDSLSTQGGQAVLFARYPEPWPRSSMLVMRTDSAHFKGILSTLQFTGSITPTPHPVNYYNSPACDIPLTDPAIKVSHSTGLTLTEYPLVNSACDPMDQFDGFQARVRALNLDTWTSYDSDRLNRVEQANLSLQPFGYRLVGHEQDLGGTNPVLASKKITTFDLYGGDEMLKTGLTQIGPVSVSSSENDFILWVEDTDNLLATEVRRDSLTSLNWWESGFNTAWVGPDLIKYEFAKDHLFPVGAPSEAVVYRNDQPIYNLTIPQSGPAGNPVQWLLSWKSHWILEVENVVVEDGELQNPKLGYAEMFDWHVVNDLPFYFFRNGDSYGLSYNGKTLPQSYTDIIHGQLCCDSALYNISSLSNGAWFYALKNGIWYLVSALVE